MVYHAGSAFISGLSESAKYVSSEALAFAGAQRDDLISNKPSPSYATANAQGTPTLQMIADMTFGRNSGVVATPT